MASSRGAMPLSSAAISSATSQRGVASPTRAAIRPDDPTGDGDRRGGHPDHRGSPGGRPPELRLHDYWLFDYRDVWRMHYHENFRFAGAER